MISGKRACPVFQRHEATSGVVYSGMDHTFRSGVAKIAARGWSAANTWVPLGRASIRPLVVMAGSWRRENREQRLQFTKQLPKFAVAIFDF
jgi:hypothetical protein